MSFTITPIIQGKQMAMQVEKTNTTPTTETYRVTIRDHSVTLQTNRLLFRQKGLKYRKGWWKVLEGHFKHESSKEAVCQSIEKADPIKISG